MKGSGNSLSSLRIFVAAAKHLNFTRAAETLHLTQSAVSKHVQALEDRLGVALFKRLPTGLRLTHAGAVYLEQVAAALRLIEEADAQVSHPDARVALNIAVSPSFAEHCLIPRLQHFFEAHPGVRINLRPRLMGQREKSERFDAEIQLHSGYVSGMTTQYVCGREMCVVAAPRLLAGRVIRSVQDLSGLPLLKRAQRGYGWDEWKAAMAPQWAGPELNAPEYEGFTLLLPAAMQGLGLAVVPFCIAASYLERGELVRPFGETVEGRFGYYLMQPRPRLGGPFLDAFCAWVSAQGRALNDAVPAASRHSILE